jgi:adenosyl cobinamide kinase/adenosyl cobinamide phosphate guanylyltransferase
MQESIERHRTILILGGARAGKSAFALGLAAEIEAEGLSPVCFIATAQASDDEMRERITRHRSERPPHWTTVEEPIRLDAALRQAADAAVIVVDCITLLVSNWLLQENERNTEKLIATIDNTITLAADGNKHLIFVSNEVGLGLVPDTPLGRQFRDTLGRVNQRLAQAVDTVFLLVAGLPLRIKPPG